MSENPAGAAAGHHGQPGGETPPGGSKPQGGETPPGGSKPQGGETPSGWGTQPGWETPWPESPATGTGRQERADLEVAFAAGLRRTGALMQLMGTAAADKVGINATDLNCLNILSFSGHMTAGELARATGLTTASITGVVDRLEEAGFVTRERDPQDRRRVVVQINLERAMKDVAKIFAPMLGSWREMAARYSDDELRLIVDFYARMEQVFRDHLVRLRGGPEATEP
jgi:DNA-binding MarR family transcriptional regulator